MSRNTLTGAVCGNEPAARTRRARDPARLHWRSWHVAGAAIALAALFGCADRATHPALENAQLPTLVQASRFAPIASEPSGYRLSPDGRKIAWIGSSYGRSTLFVRDVASGAVRRFPRVTLIEHWTADGRWLLYHTTDPTGTENAHVHAIDTEGEGTEPINLTPYPGVKARIHQLPAKEPGAVLIAHNRRDPKLFDLYRIELATGAETLLATNPGDAVAPVTDTTGALRGWQRSREATRTADERRRPLAQRRPEASQLAGTVFRVLGRSADNETVWALSNRGRDRTALVAAHPRLGWERVLFDDPHVDVIEVDMSEVQRAPLIARAVPGDPRYAILDERLRADLADLERAQGPEPFLLDIVSTDASEQRMIVLVRSAKNRRYYLVDRNLRTHTLLSAAVPDAVRDALVPTRPIELAASDGRVLHGYLTLPANVEPKRLPMVLLVHGGPWQRSHWGDPYVSDDSAYAQFLANRGYAVVQVDFRGSTGYGRDLMFAGVGEFAGKMQQDLHDAVRWAVEQGFADRGRVALLGWSYGGYASMMALALSPRAFACAVALNGPTELVSLIENFPPYWQVDLTLWHDFAGNPAVPEDREQLAEKSPLALAHAIERPLLIIHGAKDVRVGIDQAERMVAALRSAGKPIEYLRIDDMGHAPGWWVHRIKVLRATEHFLHRCVGGRASRFDPWEAVARVWERVKD